MKKLSSALTCLVLKKLSNHLQVNCTISFYFRLYLVLYIYTARFDVMENYEKFLDFR